LRDTTVECRYPVFSSTGVEELPAPERDWAPDPTSGLVQVGGEGEHPISDALAPSVGHLDVADLDLRNVCSIQSASSRHLWMSTTSHAVGVEQGNIVTVIGHDDGEYRQHAPSPDGTTAGFVFFREIVEFPLEGPSFMPFLGGTALDLDFDDGTPLAEAPAYSGIPWSITYGHDGELLLGSDRGGGIIPFIGVVRDGSNVIEELIHGAGHGDGAPEDDSIRGSVGHIETLPDGTVAFVIGTRHAYEIWLTDLDGTTPEPLGGSRQTAERQRFDTLQSLPDGRLLLTADEEVQAVDIDSGEVEVLVDLTGATGPQSAAAVGDQLYVLAGGRLWTTDL
jgi:hypothetical protein